jgi:hypothetical protein
VTRCHLQPFLLDFAPPPYIIFLIATPVGAAICNDNFVLGAPPSRRLKDRRIDIEANIAHFARELIQEASWPAGRRRSQDGMEARQAGQVDVLKADDVKGYHRQF